jgi:hypothetical protein
VRRDLATTREKVESVRRWMRQADIDAGVVNGLTSSEQSELVQLRRAAAYFEKDALQNGVPAGRRRRASPVNLHGAGFQPRSSTSGAGRRCVPVISTTPTSPNHLGDLHGEDPEFGYRFLTDELTASGHHVGEIPCRRGPRRCRRVGVGRSPSGAPPVASSAVMRSAIE